METREKKISIMRQQVEHIESLQQKLSEQQKLGGAKSGSFKSKIKADITKLESLDDQIKELGICEKRNGKDWKALADYDYYLENQKNVTDEVLEKLCKEIRKHKQRIFTA